MPLAGLSAVRTGYDEDTFTTLVTFGGETNDFAVSILERLDDFRVWRNDELVIALATSKRPTDIVCVEAHAAFLAGDGYSVCTPSIPDAVLRQQVGEPTRQRPLIPCR
jgi:hypothetical protein